MTDTPIPSPVEDWAGFDAFVKKIETSSPSLAQVMLGVAEIALQMADHDQTPRAWATQMKEDLEEVIDRIETYQKTPLVFDDPADTQGFEGLIRAALIMAKSWVSQLDQTLTGWDAGRAADIRAGFVDPAAGLTKLISGPDLGMIFDIHRGRPDQDKPHD